MRSELMFHVVNERTFTLDQFHAASVADFHDLHIDMAGPRAYPGGRDGEEEELDLR